MSRILRKSPRLQLDPESYERLRQQVLQRDGWKCQTCGSMWHVEVHHKEFRSQGGADSDENLITLCVSCHSELHRPARSSMHDIEM